MNDGDGDGDDTDDDQEEVVVKVAFRRNVFQGDNFPVKKAALPMGAQVQLTCRSSSTAPSAAWEVIHFTLLTNPHELAVASSTTEQGGISCTYCLRSRRQAFDAGAAVSSCIGSSSDMNRLPAAKAQRMKPNNTSGYSNNRPPIHEYSAGSSKVFAAWIGEHLLRSDGSDRVLDVAGGKGLLSVQLAGLGIACTVVDPVQRRAPKALRKLKKDETVVPPEFVAAYFERNEAAAELAQSHTCLIGLHPDQPTEDILDVALAHNKSVAIVPCCVFPDLFSTRMLNNKPVRSYDEFLQYLLAKDGRLRQTMLPFEGKNECIYLKVPADG